MLKRIFDLPFNLFIAALFKSVKDAVLKTSLELDLRAENGGKIVGKSS